jgi:nuclease S1
MIRWLAPAATMAVVLAVFAERALSWGCSAHQTIALLAAPQLTTHARAEIERLLGENPADPGLERFCADRGGTAFSDASTWADDVRKTREYADTAAWHFLDIPRGAKHERVSKYCPRDGCVTRALNQQIAILKSAAAARKRADALRFVIHLVGDIHQPLHCATNADRGGNCVPVELFGRPPSVDGDGKAAPNLHAVWDTELIARNPNASGPAAFASYLTKNYQTKMPAWRLVGLDFDAWAWESHELAESVAYGKLPRPIPIETRRTDGPSCVMRGDNVSKRMLAAGEKIDASYETAARPFIEAQLAKAGARLALVLNDVWP